MTCRNLDLSCRAVLVPGRATVTYPRRSAKPASLRQRRLRERQRRGEIVVPPAVSHMHAAVSFWVDATIDSV